MTRARQMSTTSMDSLNYVRRWRPGGGRPAENVLFIRTQPSF
jgi:hypothetical protein